MGELYRTYRNRMLSAKTYMEFDAIELSALRSYLFDNLSDAEYKELYSLWFESDLCPWLALTTNARKA